MSTGLATNATTQLSPTSYLVLGLLAREGPSTPYDLKRYVAATMGHFWSFPHALLYAEPPRLVALGLGTENQEEHGRRRRTFTITNDGVDALRAWLKIPSLEPTELRDPGLLQLFFADLGSSDDRRLIADEQLPLHRAKLAGYEEDERLDREAGAAVESPTASRTLEHWRGQTVHMGVLYERAAVDFWEGVVAGRAGAPGEAGEAGRAGRAGRAGEAGDEARAARARAADDGAAVASNDVGQSINNEA